MVADKEYMCQLLDIQHMRGATSGHVFTRLLKGDQSDGTSWIFSYHRRRYNSHHGNDIICRIFCACADSNDVEMASSDSIMPLRRQQRTESQLKKTRDLRSSVRSDSNEMAQLIVDVSTRVLQRGRS